MKRIFLYSLTALVLLAALLVAISPLLLSHYTYRHYHQIIGRLIPRDNIQLHVLSYQRGWYTDHATVLVDLSNSKWRINGKDHVTFQQTIHLGPLVKQKYGHYRWQIARIENQYLDDKTHSTGEIIINLDRSVIVDNSINLINVNENNNQAQLSDLVLHLESKIGSTDTGLLARHIETNNADPKAKLYFRADGIGVHNLKTKSATQQKQTTQIQIDDLSVYLNPGQPLHAKQVSVQKDSISQPYHLSTRYQIKMEELQLDPPVKPGDVVGNKPVNPKTIRAITADFTLSGLSPALISQLSYDLQTFLQPKMHNQWWLLQDVLRILSHGVSLQIKQLNFTTAEGNFSLTGEIQIPPSAGEFHLLKPLSQLRADIKGSVPQQWLLSQILAHQKTPSHKQATERLSDWLKADVIRSEKNQLLFSLLYKHGHFYLNSPDHHKYVRFYWVNHDKHL